jgi:leucyl-tRNA synthetase
MTYQTAINSIEQCYRNKHVASPNAKFTYVVPMFPYPSGNIHMGHVRNYTITNAISQYFKVKGQSVIHPIGFDAFGLPAENAAIKNQKSPNDWTENNIEKMKKDFQNIGFDFDWEACTQTNDPKYYSFEQEIFKKAWNSGIIYKKEQYVNYDPVDHTVLSNEQVKDGKGWRTGADIVRKKIPMYFFNMKKYAKALYEDLDIIKNTWPSQVIEMQKHWIDYQVGIYRQYKINKQTIDVFEKQNKFNAISIGINHPFVESFKNDDFSSWVKENEVGSVSNKDSFKKKKIFDTGFFVEYDTNKIPVFIDMDGDDEAIFTKIDKEPKCEIECIFVKEYQGEFIGLKDWCISRQRYWGNPIPIIHCSDCGDIVASEFVELPTDLIPKIGNALSHEPSFVNCSCPSCGKTATRCTDTMDTFVQSSWYFHYYITKIFGNDYGITHKDTQIDYYVGGIEHATMHLIYARFFHKMLKDFGYVNTNEPIKKLITQGMVCKKYVNSEGKTVSAKMSKSIGNIVEPQQYIEQYSSDALQMFMIFSAPPNQNFDFEDAGIVGCHRFLDDVYRYFFEENNAQKTFNQNQAKQAVEKMIQQFDREFTGRFNLNILIPQLMTAFKTIKKTQFVSEDIRKEVETNFVRYLGIFAPKISHYIQLNCEMKNEPKKIKM